MAGECGESNLPRVGVYPGKYDGGRQDLGNWKEVSSKDEISRMEVRVRAGRRNSVSKSIQGSRNMMYSHSLEREHISSAGRLG